MNVLDADRDACAWSAAFAVGRAMPPDLLATCLERIEAHDARLGICNHVARRDRLFEAAAASAERWRRGAPLSPLDGIPFGVKANVAVAGFPWHGGIAAFRARRAGQDAECVRRLRSAGLIPAALFNMHEAALGETTDNAAFRTTLNPHDPRCIPGGSSGGSAAAVAAGLVPVALGTDDLGSVRLPSALCGVVGFKPAHDVVSRKGVVPLSPRLDHVGIHARSVGDVAAVMNLVGGDKGACGPAAGPDAGAANDACSLARWRLPLELALDEPIAAACERILAEHAVTACIDWSDVDFSALRRAGLLVCERDAADYFEGTLQEDPDGFSPAFRRLVAWGAAQAQDKVQRAESLLCAMAQRLRADLAGTLLLSPTTPHVAPRRGGEVPVALADLTAPAAIAGLPAVSVPMETSPEGLPMGLQIAGLDDDQVLSAALALQPGIAACAAVVE